MVIFHSYVSLPEGIWKNFVVFFHFVLSIHVPPDTPRYHTISYIILFSIISHQHGIFLLLHPIISNCLSPSQDVCPYILLATKKTCILYPHIRGPLRPFASHVVFCF